MTARSIGDIAVAYAARRNDPVRRNSYDVEDPRAKVFKRIGDGSTAQGFAHRGACLETFDALFEQQKSERYKGPNKLQGSYRHIFKTLLKFLDFKTGELFPAIETIAARAGAAKQTVIDCLACLKQLGVLDWVRRSVRNNEGDGPPRKQTSNAYVITLASAAKAIRRTFILALARRRRKMGNTPPSPSSTPQKAQNPALEAALSRLDAAVAKRVSLSP